MGVKRIISVMLWFCHRAAWVASMIGSSSVVKTKCPIKFTPKVMSRPSAVVDIKGPGRSPAEKTFSIRSKGSVRWNGGAGCSPEALYTADAGGACGDDISSDETWQKNMEDAIRDR